MSSIVECTTKYQIQFDGSVDAYVELADRIAKGLQSPGYEVGLDSYDAGDATGLFIEMWDKHHDEDGIWVYRSTEPPLLVTVTRDSDFFVWDPPLTEGGS